MKNKLKIIGVPCDIFPRSKKILTGYYSKDEICDRHAATGGYESCCFCENDDPNDQRECLESKEE